MKVILSIVFIMGGLILASLHFQEDALTRYYYQRGCILQWAPTDNLIGILNMLKYEDNRGNGFVTGWDTFGHRQNKNSKYLRGFFQWMQNNKFNGDWSAVLAFCYLDKED